MTGYPRKLNDGFKTQMEREVLRQFLNVPFFKAGLRSGVTSTNVQLYRTWTGGGGSMSALVFTIDGYAYYTSLECSGNALPAGDGQSNCASNHARMWAVCLNSGGSIVAYAGSVVSAGDTTYVGSAVPNSVCVVGLVKISCASTVSWTWGTNGFSSASLTSITVEYWDCAFLPQGVILSD